MKIRLGSRGSKLALAQTEFVKQRLEESYPSCECEIVIIKTQGDNIQHKPLDQIGDKGLFVKEIEEQLLRNEIDLGVHSMKDMPSSLAEGLCFTKTWKREDPRDVLILREAKSFLELPSNAVLATGSKRRIYQLKQMRQDLNFVGIRGNIDTRLRKMQEEKLDGIVLAAAGLHRLGMRENITEYLDFSISVPAAAQGALALEIRRENEQLKQMLDALSDEVDHERIQAERAFLEKIGGGCHIPAGAVCLKEEGVFRLRAVLGEEKTEKICRIELEDPDPVNLGVKAAEFLLKSL